MHEDWSTVKRLTISDIAARCDKVRWQGRDSFNACCKAHPDNNPSMSVTESPDGKLLAHCFAGCSQADVLDALGITSGRPLYTVGSGIQTPIQPQSQTPTFFYAKKIWAATKPEELISCDVAVSQHPYAIKKQIKHACGAARSLVTGSQIGRQADCVILPMRSLEGEFTGIEAISSEGVKQSFGSKGVLVLGNDMNSSLPQLVVEGWATGVAVLRAYEWNICVYVTFGKGRLTSIASQIKTKYPDRKVVILGEQDGK